MRISDWSSDVCSSDLFARNDATLKPVDQCEARLGIDAFDPRRRAGVDLRRIGDACRQRPGQLGVERGLRAGRAVGRADDRRCDLRQPQRRRQLPAEIETGERGQFGVVAAVDESGLAERRRSEEHTSELQSLMRISYAVFCLKKKKNTKAERTTTSSYIK